ncbi:MAG TPA: cob(I)yrinic acid a,c-diamide adenosyltransferase [Coriobacteriia bacterium]
MGSIYTRVGDDGTSALAGGERLRKDDPRFELLGAMDEANSLIGLARPPIIDSELDTVLEFVQQRLLNCGAMVAGASGDAVSVTEADIRALEAEIDRLSAHLGGFDGFVLPGCDEASARLHVARAVIRRAERAAVGLASHQPVDRMVLVFLNRASDLLYAAARYAGAGGECRWDPEAKPPAHDW